MSQGDVELVREFWEAFERSFDSFWENPQPIGPLVAADELPPAAREVYRRMHPEVVWRPSFLSDELRGHAQIAATWDEYLTWAEDYRGRLEEVTDLGDGRVFCTVAISYRAKAGGDTMKGRLYFVMTVEDGLITLMDEFTERSDAIEAVGLD